VRIQHQLSGEKKKTVWTKHNNTGTWFLRVMMNYVMGHL